MVLIFCGASALPLQDRDLLAQVTAGDLQNNVLQAKLTEHVDKIDTDLAIEYQVQQGLAGGNRETLYLTPLAGHFEHGPELHSQVAVVRLLQRT